MLFLDVYQDSKKGNPIKTKNGYILPENLAKRENAILKQENTLLKSQNEEINKRYQEQKAYYENII